MWQCAPVIPELGRWTQVDSWGSLVSQLSQIGNSSAVVGDLVSKKHPVENQAVKHAFNPRTQEAKVGGSLSFRPAWFAERVPE